MPQATAMIETDKLSLRLGEYLVVRDLTLRIEPGQIFGLLGPFGSGKSTTLKLLAGMLHPTGGRACVDGLDVAAEPARARARVGYMPGYLGAYDDFQVRGYLEFFARACGVDPAAAAAHIDRLLALAGLTDQAEQYLSAIDVEARHRLAVVKTAVHDPPILLFDEPAVGLPTDARVRQRRLIAELAAAGSKTVLICSNILTDLLGLCRSLGIMHGGRLLTSGPTETIARRLTGARILELEPAASAEELMRLLSAHPAIDAANTHGGRVLASLAGEIDDPGKVIREIVAAGGAVAAFREHQIDLDLLVEQKLVQS
jgi:ABC-2 type transport system ATP-binding protein